MFEVLESLGVVHLTILAFTIFFAAILRAFSGFGFALAALPIMSLFLTPSTSVSIIALLTLFVSVRTIKEYWGTVPIKPFIPLLVLKGAGTLIGAYLLHKIPLNAFQVATGVVVMTASFLLTRMKPFDAKPGGFPAVVVGSLSGLLNGAVAMPGPPVIIYAMSAFKEPAKSRGFMMTIFLFSAIFAVIGYTMEGHLGTNEIWLFLIILPAMLAGDKLGFYLFKKYGNAVYRKVAIGALFAIGASVTLKALV